MGQVIVNAAVSLDGFIADTAGHVGPLFDYYENGEVEAILGDPDRDFKVTAITAGYLERPLPPYLSHVEMSGSNLSSVRLARGCDVMTSQVHLVVGHSNGAGS